MCHGHCAWFMFFRRHTAAWNCILPWLGLVVAGLVQDERQLQPRPLYSWRPPRACLKARCVAQSRKYFGYKFFTAVEGGRFVLRKVVRGVLRPGPESRPRLTDRALSSFPA